MTQKKNSTTPKFSDQLAEAARPLFEMALESEEEKQKIIKDLDGFILSRTGQPQMQMVLREIKRTLLSDDFESLKKLEVETV